jgi:hypothetical protein
VRDEAEAKKQLEQEWSKLGSDRKRECVEESAIGGDQSYVEHITCLDTRCQSSSATAATGGNRLRLTRSKLQRRREDLEDEPRDEDEKEHDYLVVLSRPIPNLFDKLN